MMKIKTDLPSIQKDNNQSYINMVTSAVAHADPEASLEIRRASEGLMFHISPSIPDRKEHIIQNILGLHKKFHLKTNFSKSTKISSKISFSVKLEENKE